MTDYEILAIIIMIITLALATHNSKLYSHITKDNYEPLQALVNTYAGTGEIRVDETGDGIMIREYVQMIREYVQMNRDIGKAILPASKKEEPTGRAQIIYSKDGVHVIPVKNEQGEQK